MTEEAKNTEEPIMLLEFTPTQLAIIREIRAQEVAKKAMIRFDAPERDETVIREIVYQDGSVDILTYLLGFDAKMMSEAEKRKEEALSQQQNPSLFTPSF